MIADQYACPHTVNNDLLTILQPRVTGQQCEGGNVLPPDARRQPQLNLILPPRPLWISPERVQTGPREHSVFSCRLTINGSLHKSPPSSHTDAVIKLSSAAPGRSGRAEQVMRSAHLTHITVIGWSCLRQESGSVRKRRGKIVFQPHLIKVGLIFIRHWPLN